MHNIATVSKSRYFRSFTALSPVAKHFTMKISCISAIIIFAILAISVPAEATTYTVDSLDDIIGADGYITLREAIEAANTNADVNEAAAGSETEADEINFAPALFASGPATITLNGTELPITEHLTINGPGRDLLTVDANELSRIMNITNTEASIGVANLTLAGGYTDDNGGGIQNIGTLTISNTTIQNNTAYQFGGGISSTGTLTLSDSTVSSNTAGNSFGGGGAGLYNSRGTLTVTNAIFSDNDGIIGGAITNYYGTATVTDTTLDNNRATIGGAIHCRGGTAILSHLTLTHNWGKLGGGALYTERCVATLANSTVTGNTTNSQGGGIYNYDGLVNLITVEIAGNSALANGGGIYCKFYEVILTCSTLAGNSADESGASIESSTGTITINNSLISPSHKSGILNFKGNCILNNSYAGAKQPFVRDPSPGADAIWGTSDDDFGDLHLTGKVAAINTGDNALAVDADGNPLTTDIDGNPRIVHGQTDIGAYEYQADLAEPLETRSTIVTTVADIMDSTDGEISLREAIFYGGLLKKDITFADTLAGATITLDAQELGIYSSQKIDASSVGGIIIDADNQSGCMGTYGNQSSIELTALTITGGNSISGGGIANSSSLTINDSTVIANSASLNGGGIYNTDTVLLTNSTVTQNSTDGNGGGIHNDYGPNRIAGILILKNSSVSTCTANADGGGIYSDHGTLILENSSVSTCTANADGGGICCNQGEITLTDSSLSANSATVAGGGIHCYISTVTLTNTTLDENHAHGKGGGLYLHHGVATLTNLTLLNDSAGTGGGLYCVENTTTLTDSTLTENTASGYGGAIYGYESTVTIRSSMFTDNSAGYRGGAIHVRKTNRDVSLIIEKSTLTNNSAKYGGAISSTTDLTIEKSILTDNSCTANGGGIFISGGAAHLTNSTFHGNYAGNQGGVICAHNGAKVTNSVFSGNSAGTHGGGIYNSDSSTLYLTNTTVTSNSSGYGGGICNDADKAFDLNNSIVALNNARNSDDNISGLYESNNSIVSLEPGFVRNPSAGPDEIWGTDDDYYGDLRLRPDSRAIDAGDTELAVDIDDIPLATDVRGADRWVGESVDIGAYEFQDWVADANGDEVVNLDDFIVLKQIYGHPNATKAHGDFNGDGRVDLDDFIILKQNYGSRLIIDTDGE